MISTLRENPQGQNLANFHNPIANGQKALQKSPTRQDRLKNHLQDRAKNHPQDEVKSLLHIISKGECPQ